jgi:uncharacterized protein YcbK (DUF882 family)
MNSGRRSFLIGGGAAAASIAAGGASLMLGSCTSMRTSAASTTTAVAQAAPVAPPVISAPPAPAVLTRPAADVKRLFLHNLHTGETIKTEYWADGAYIPGALAEARHALRDWRNGQQHQMDPELFDLFHDLSARLESDRPFQVICGYRSPQTNAMLHARSSQVAAHSLHMDGKATDLRIEGVELAHLRKAAVSLGRGGVGFYPVSDFVHVDTGRVRQWSGA